MTKTREELLAPPSPSAKDDLKTIWNRVKQDYADSSPLTKYLAGVNIVATGSLSATVLGGALKVGDAGLIIQENVLNSISTLSGTGGDFAQAAVYFGAAVASFYTAEYAALAAKTSLVSDRVEKALQKSAISAHENSAPEL